MRTRKYKYYVGDFETTVYKGQEDTQVWASACVELFTDDVHIFHSIDETFEYLSDQYCNIIIYYHNLKFDGQFWLSYLMTQLHFEQAFDQPDPDVMSGTWIPVRKMKNNTFRYSISHMGQWYSITIKVHNCVIEIRDSLKLLPFSVKRIGKGFKTKHQKLDMEYEGFRYPGCVITDEEQKYIANDVLVVKEAMEIMFKEGHDKLTIGACCLYEYEKTVDDFDRWFPNIYDFGIVKEKHKYANAGEWVRRSYKGGWCYLVKGKENIMRHNGTTADVNSLYPSMMSSESGNRYPVGLPTFWTGNYIPDEALSHLNYYFIRIKTRFYIKPGYLPFIQIKGNMLYKGTECLMSSDVYDEKTDAYYDKYYDKRTGVLHDTRVELTLTMTDFELMKEHYELVDFELLDGCYFRAYVGIFDEYIEKYKKMKLESTGARRELAKLFLNNLYGKMASNTDSSFKYAYVDDDGTIGFMTVVEDGKKPGYIPCGSAITSYARNFTIRAAQKNFHGVNKPGFIYADTDSIHCDLSPEHIKGIKVHPKDFCCWKLEASWDMGLFVRQKTYIEHVVAEDLEPIDNPYYNVKCAGMPQKCKDLFLESVKGYSPKEGDKYDADELEFLQTKRDITDFKIGLRVPGKLMPKRIRGGVLLVPTTYEMR